MRMNVGLGPGKCDLDWEIINDLKFQANFSANFDSHANNLFLESWNLGSLSQQDYYSKDYGSGYDLRMLYTLTYDHTFGEKHYVKGMVGYEAYRATASSAGGWKTVSWFNLRMILV